MILRATGNLLEAKAEALVNTVNCVGTMGKGIALQFKKAFPDNFRAYAQACRAQEVKPGRMLVYETRSSDNPRFIINFPTKRHWKGKANLGDIRSGLAALVKVVREKDLRSIAVPPLGCGLGGLAWNEVRPLIEKAFSGLPEVTVHLFEPAGAPLAAAMPIGTERPPLTVARALFLRLMKLYREMDYRLTLLEIQKLAYFLQEAGQPLKLQYVGHIFGPFAQNLYKVLELLEGHYIQGYGDSQRPDVEIELRPGAAEEAAQFLADEPESQARLGKVARLIEGFETPYGMELLASVHWMATHDPQPATSASEAVAKVQGWNARKAKVFSGDHIELAWDRLSRQGWLSPRNQSAPALS